MLRGVVELASHEAIRRLIAVYAQLLDSGRLEEWGELFAEDATFEVWGKTLRGRREIVAAIGGMQPERPGKHVCLMPVIDLVAPDRALAWTDLSAFASSPDGISIATIGRYHDELVRQGGRWRFARRSVVMAGEPLPDGVAPSPAW
jgi:uncharacterized protein (TIGR02246 family)